MGPREEAENERRSRAMVDAQKPVRYWQRKPITVPLVDRLDALERQVAEPAERLGHSRR